VKTTEELTDRQKKFAEAFLELSNGTKAAIEAGYAGAGAHTGASRLLKNVKVKGLKDFKRNAENASRVVWWAWQKRQPK
jgi:phage terminase small subunit